MGYIEDLRKKIGHDLVILVGSGVIVHKGGKVLLQKRTDDGRWALHGGCKELGETTEETAKRELFEETGLIADELTLLGVFSGEAMRHTYPHGDDVEFVLTFYICDSFHGELNPQPEEVSTLEWFDLDALPEDLASSDKLALESFIASINNP